MGQLRGRGVGWGFGAEGLTVTVDGASGKEGGRGGVMVGGKGCRIVGGKGWVMVGGKGWVMVSGKGWVMVGGKGRGAMGR